MGRGAIERRRARRAQDPEIQARRLERQATAGVELRRQAAELKRTGDREGFRRLLREARRLERGE